MGKDSGWKRYFSDNRRYADIINGIGCEGKQLVQEADLDDADSQGRTKKTRDLIRKTAFGVNFALIGIENQDTMDYEIPLRTMHYDVAEYEKQAAEIRRTVRENRNGLRSGEYLYGYRKSDKLKPVITFVLYSGKEVWDGPTSLQEMLDFTDIPERLREMTSDYKINVISIRQFEHTEVFRTDVRQVFDFIRCSEDKEKLRQLVENDVYYRHMDEDAYDVVAWYTNSTELMQVRDYQREDGKIDMCTAIREMMEDSRREGMAEGIKVLIETCRELGLSREDTLLRTANKFNMCKDEVEDYMAQYWK
ncbi:MAG: Rpn family recombination-promoting nuclease/putative transposase [Roseburia sp.]